MVEYGAAGVGERGASASAGESPSSSASVADMLSFISAAEPAWRSKWSYKSGGCSLGISCVLAPDGEADAYVGA